MSKLIAFVLLAGAIAVLTAIPATAKQPAGNGRIVFARFDPALDDDFIYTANPDGSHEQQLLATGAEGPRWSKERRRLETPVRDFRAAGCHAHLRGSRSTGRNRIELDARLTQWCRGRVSTPVELRSLHHP
jgi:hypothetical protein